MHILLIALIVQLVASQEQTPPASIAGTVVDSATGRPIVDAGLALDQVGAGAVGRRQAKTDSKGAFAFRDLPVGRYNLLATHPDYLDQSHGIPPESPMRGAVLEFRLTAGQALQPQIRMLRAATISGHVYDSTRAPVANANVSPRVLVPQILGPAILNMIQPYEGTGADGSRQFVKTNDRGEYRISGLPAGEYYIGAAPTVVTATRTGANNAATTYYPGTRNPDQAVTVKVAGGSDVLSIDITLEPLPALKISGKIINPLVGQLKEGVDYGYQYFLVPRGARVTEPPGSATATLVDRDPAADQFELQNVAPGTYDAFVAYSTRPTNPRIGFQYQVGRAVVNVVDRDATGVDVTIVPGKEIAGQLVLDESAKTALPNLRNISFYFQPADALPRTYAPQLDSTRGPGIAADGTFTMTNVTPGAYYLNLYLDLGRNVYLASARLGPRNILNIPFEVDASTSEPLVLEVSGQAGAVEGVVADRDGKASPNARVILIPPLEMRQQGFAYKQETTNAQGRFSIVGIRPGVYTAYAFATLKDGAWIDPQFMSQHAASGVQITVDRNSKIQRDLRLIP